MTKKNFSNSTVSIPKLYDSGGDVKAKWYVEYCDEQGKRIKVYKLTDDSHYSLNKFKTEAERRKYAERIIAQICSNKAEVLTAEQAIEIVDTSKHGNRSITSILFVCLLENQRHYKKKTYQTMYCKVKLFDEYCRMVKIKMTISDNQVNGFFDYLKRKKRSNATINAYRGILSSLYNIAIEKKYIKATANPFKAQKILKEQRQGCKPFSNKQKRELKEYISTNDPILWVCCQLLYYCFIRPGEIRLLKVGDIDLENYKILIRASISKNKKSEYVSIPYVFAERLKALGIEEMNTGLYLIGKDHIGSSTPTAENALAKRHLRILKKKGYDTGYGEFAFYGWKHTGVIAAVKAGINLRELQLQLRHHSLDEMQHYLRNLGISDSQQVLNQFPEI
jgi:integrase